MADKISFKVDVTGAGTFTPNPDAGLGGGPAGVVKKDGIYQLKIEKLTPVFSDPKPGSPAKPMLELQGRVVDADEAGIKLYGNVICGGLDRNGEPLVRQLFEFLHSAGVPAATIQQLAQYRELDVEQLLTTYLPIGKTFFANVRTEPKFNGTGLTSKINGFVPPENAQKAIAENKHRWEIRAEAKVAPATLPAMPAAAGSLPGLPGLPAGVPAAMPTNGAHAAAPAALPGLPGLPPLPR